MLLSKFSVLLQLQRSKQKIVKVRNFFSKKCPAVDKTLCPRAYDLLNPHRESVCDRYKESLIQCPKQQSKCETGKPTNCLEPPHAAEIFRSAYLQVRKEALNVQIFVRNSVNAIASSMMTENAQMALSMKATMRKKLAEIDAKVEEITGLSFVCGDQKRMEGYVIGERINAELRTWECENAGSANCVKQRLEDLECYAKERTDTAVELVRTCRGCVSPKTLMHCVQEATRASENILKTTDEYATKELASIAKIKAESLHDNAEIAGRMMDRFEREASEFLKHLDSLIVQLRKSRRT